MEKGKKYLLIMGCFLLLYSVVGASRLSGNAEEQIPELPEAESIYHSDFSNQKGSWQDLVGKAEVAQNATGLMISNKKQGTNLESVTLNKDAPKRSSGDFETTFLYEDQANIGVVFRADEQKTDQWQSFAYNRDGQWQLGQPGGKWLTAISGPTLIAGQKYKLLLQYEGSSFRAFLNDQLFYENQKVNYPNGTAIDGDWTGYVGIRLFGNLSKLKVLSMRSGPIGSLPVEDHTAEFMKLQEKWQNQLVSDHYDPNNPTMADYVQMVTSEAEALYQTINKASDRTSLWPLEQGNTASADVTTQFTKLQKMALAYGTKGSSLYQDDAVATTIIDGIDFMVTRKGYDGKKYHGNWWDWQIGVPQKLISTLMILGAELPSEKLQQYTAIISSYVPDPFKQLYTKTQGSFTELAFIPNFVTSGANRTDLALTVLGLGILQRDAGKITQASASIEEVFQLVTKGDGFYKDGSFIQHNTIPYTGSYGNVLIKGVGQILAITQGSSFEMDADLVQTFVKNVDQAFLPLIYQGEMLPLVNGRSISRAPAKTKAGYGSSTVYNLLIVSQFAPTQYQQKFREAAKYWLKENPDYYLTNARDFNDLQMTMNLLADPSITGDALPFTGTKLYASMDRFVQRTTDYMVGLGLYSSRISSFEAGNKENKRGWHTADGMLYLYNDDQVQFNSSYWPTVDPYRLPGTTVDTIQLADENSAFTTVTSPEKWVGGVAYDGAAAVGMALNKTGTKNNGNVLPMNVRAKKSWFIIDGQIVALGAGITGDTTASIETVVDNRLLNDAYTYQILSDQGSIDQLNETSSKQWLLLDSDHSQANIGYYFPEETTVNVVSETRTGSYTEINEAFPSNAVYTGEYRKFLINHGKNPMEDHYAYVMLPGINETELTAYAQEEPLEILANTSEVQAVKLDQTDYLGINFWQNDGGSVADITTNKPLSLIRTSREGKTIYAFSDPTQTTTTMTLKLPKDYQKIVSQSDGISYDASTNLFTVNFAEQDGGNKVIVVE
jgi:hyaluronate lyase